MKKKVREVLKHNKVELEVPKNLKLPTKVRVVLRGKEDSYEVYFWLKGRRGEGK